MEESGKSPVVRPGRRLSDKILAAFHHACDYREFETAAELLRVLEDSMARNRAIWGTQRRREQENLVAAYARLWELRHPERA